MSGFVEQHASEIGRLTLEHLWLTASALLLACAIAVPLGVLMTRYRTLAQPSLFVANTLQTIPSLALFGFLLPLPWLGERAERVRPRRRQRSRSNHESCAEQNQVKS